MHLVSVIIPVYNIEAYLSRCLDSVICQTYSDLEIIVIDDGSTDNSCMVAKEYAERDRRIHVMQMEHMGITRIRKAGVQVATGEYMVFVDGDDWIEADCIEVWMQNIGDADILLSGYIIEPEEHIYQPPLDEGYYPAEKMGIIREKLFGSILTASNKELISENLWNNLYKSQVMKDIIDEVPDMLCVLEDKVMVCLAVLASEKVYVKWRTAYHYCMRENSLCNGKVPSILMDLALTYDCLRTVVGKHFESEILLSALCQYICLWLYEVDFPRLLGYPEYHQWYYPYYGRLQGKRVILYGAGEVGKSFYRQITYHNEGSIVAWVDKAYGKYKEEGLPVFPVEQIRCLEYDFILIAVCDENIADEIKCDLMNLGVAHSKLLWNKTHV